MMAGNGQVSVPPGFRFHPTDEELLYYYLRKKVCYEAIDLDVIREVDLNKLEPWDLKEKCRIGSGPQNEWYFFSHKDKKYPTGTRTNRATRAGFWKATGRDKAIHLGSSDKRIGMRKTLVFYTGRAPHGHKTDWIMHEYRLDDDHHHHHHNSDFIQAEDGWVVCRVFKKKSQSRGFPAEAIQEEYYYSHSQSHAKQLAINASSAPLISSDHDHLDNAEESHNKPYDHYAFDGNGMHLPQLFSPEHSSSAPPPPVVPINSYLIWPGSLNPMELGCSQNLLRLATSSSSPADGNININNCGLLQLPAVERFNNSYNNNNNNNNNNNDWSFLDKLLASHRSLQDQQSSHSQHNSKGNTSTAATATATASQVIGAASSIQKFSIPWL